MLIVTWLFEGNNLVVQSTTGESAAISHVLSKPAEMICFSFVFCFFRNEVFSNGTVVHYVYIDVCSSTN